eukprot:6204457-Pleurochrysis_carterae.AAC.1
MQPCFSPVESIRVIHAVETELDGHRHRLLAAVRLPGRGQRRSLRQRRLRREVADHAQAGLGDGGLDEVLRSACAARRRAPRGPCGEVMSGDGGGAAFGNRSGLCSVHIRRRGRHKVHCLVCQRVARWCARERAAASRFKRRTKVGNAVPVICNSVLVILVNHQKAHQQADFTASNDGLLLRRTGRTWCMAVL